MKKLKPEFSVALFNPIHRTPCFSQLFCEFGEVDEVWFVVSPHNPLKNRSTYGRMSYVSGYAVAIGDYPHFHASDLNFIFPSFLHNTHTGLFERIYPDRISSHYRSDNWQRFGCWRESERIIAENQLLVYPRPGYPVNKDYPSQCAHRQPAYFWDKFYFIRYALAEGKDVRYFLHPKHLRRTSPAKTKINQFYTKNGKHHSLKFSVLFRVCSNSDQYYFERKIQTRT